MNGHFRIERDAQDLAWLTFDMADSPVNLLNEQTLESLDEALVTVAQTHPRGLALLSAKPGGFAAGADIHALGALRDPTHLVPHIERVHDILRRLEALAFPTVAVIHGHCVGGGLELALACRYRIARLDPATRLGLPEVRLGIFPGYGGTVRATRTIGHLQALELMLSGRSLDARAAERIGLVDLAVPERQLRQTARRLLLAPPRPHRAGWLRGTLAGLAPVRPVLAGILRRRLAAKAPPEHYPAPYALLRHWRRHAGRPVRMYHGEATEVARLLTTDTARNLIRVFKLQERLKGLGDRSLFRPRHVHVVGAGVMGGDIAAWCALCGLRVSLQDRSPELIGRAVQRAAGLFRTRLRDPYRIRAAMDRLMPDPRGYGVPRADVLIEAIYEDARAKRALYAELEPRMATQALLATNTSSIPLESLAEGLTRPERLVGLHFFNPVARMQLVEVVHSAHTDETVLARAAAFARHIDRLPLPVKSSPGFLVNRVLLPYLLEAVRLLEEGVPAPVIDRAAVDFGMPIGPVELADTVGLDICLAAARQLSELLHTPVPERLSRLVEARDLGRKTGRGLYGWRHGRPEKGRPPHGYRPPEDLMDRLVLRLINEAVACLREEVVADADLLDAGMIFATGFAPFRGGPLCYARQRGGERLRQRLHELELRHGHEFHIDAGWPALS